MKARLTILFALFVLTSYGQRNDSMPKQLYIDTVIVTIGHKIYIENESVNTEHLNLKPVDAISDSSKTIIIEFKDSRTMGSVLTIKNPFDKNLVYKAAIYTPKQQTYTITDVSPVRKKLIAIELWESGIPKVRLTDFQLADTK